MAAEGHGILRQTHVLHRLRMIRLTAFPICCAVLLAAPASAQLPAGFTLSKQWTIERLGDNHWKLIGAVEVEKDNLTFFADEVDIYTDTDLLTAQGNVVFTDGVNRIAADRMDFNTETELGTFYNAAGSVAITNRVDLSMFGTQEPDAYFYGEQVEKIGVDRYKISRGGFTTCLQPTPRWEMISTTATLNLDHYAILRNAVLRVKGVPVFYMPVFYYPIQADDRATGFLIPMYGNSTFRGQSLSNAFFWAINRSQDATILHDWFTSTGQGIGGEYRYVTGAGSRGNARAYLLNEHETPQANPLGGEPTILPARRSYNIDGAVSQTLPAGLNARGNVNYFTDVTTQQLYQNNIFDASQSSRNYGANVTGAWGAYSINGTFNVNETFFGESDSSQYGTTPRLSFAIAPTQLGPIYFSFNSDFARQVKNSQSRTGMLDQGLDRLEFSPSVRYPFTAWPFFTVTTSLTWRNTYYTESLVDGVQTTTPLNRQYFDLQAEFIGPTFVKIFDTPDNGYAERFKHVIEPSVTIQRLTPIENQDAIVKIDSGDFTIGDVTRMRYGITNRFLGRVRQPEGPPVAREFLSVDIFQSYYTDPSYIDFSFQSSLSGRAPSKFSPIAVNTRASITDILQGTVRLEYDHEVSSFTNIGVNGTIGWQDNVFSTVGWSRVSNGTSVSSNFINSNIQLRTANNRLGGNYSFNFDFARQSFIQQRIIAYYNAQCCGVSIEYQTYDLARFASRLTVPPQDRRFNISFTLAGIGTFSNFFNAFGGTTQ